MCCTFVYFFLLKSHFFIYSKLDNSVFDRGQMIRNMGDSLSSELKECLPIFLERLKNEITRLTAVKALTMIAG